MSGFSNFSIQTKNIPHHSIYRNISLEPIAKSKIYENGNPNLPFFTKRCMPVGQCMPSGIHLHVSLGSHSFMSLQWILLKLCRFSKFRVINNSNYGGGFFVSLKNAKNCCYFATLLKRSIYVTF